MRRIEIDLLLGLKSHWINNKIRVIVRLWKFLNVWVLDLFRVVETCLWFDCVILSESNAHKNFKKTVHLPKSRVDKGLIPYFVFDLIFGVIFRQLLHLLVIIVRTKSYFIRSWDLFCIISKEKRAWEGLLFTYKRIVEDIDRYEKSKSHDQYQYNWLKNILGRDKLLKDYCYSLGERRRLALGSERGRHILNLRNRLNILLI